MGGAAHINGKKYPEFDNFYPCEFEIKGHIWRCAEQYFQSRKSDEPKFQELIKSVRNGREAWEAGQKASLNESWESMKVDIMYVANKEKFLQNPHLRDLLVNSEGKIDFFASMPFWNQKNAEILERLRSQLRGLTNES